jgi:hypothetical protein
VVTNGNPNIRTLDPRLRPLATDDPPRPEELPPPTSQKTFRIVTPFHIDYSNAQPIFTYAYCVDPLSSCTLPLGHSFDGPVKEGFALFVVAGIRGME